MAISTRSGKTIFALTYKKPTKSLKTTCCCYIAVTARFARARTASKGLGPPVPHCFNARALGSDAEHQVNGARLGALSVPGLIP